MADWQAQAAAELGRLTAPNATKKRNTVIALVDARLAGTPEEAIWKRPDTCSRAIYHGKWRKDPIFASVLENVEKLARGWKDGESARSLEEAARLLALASPLAVRKVLEVLRDSRDDQAILRAAFGLLDRAGVETAAKSSAEVSGPDGDAIQVRFVDYRKGLGDGAAETEG